MILVLVMLVSIFLVALIVAPIMFMQARTRMREQKNIERGLKMVPLLIHLPPSSDDTDGAGRDVRDLVDENVSKAQIVYNIISSTLKKGFKSRLYGQRHFSFEIIASKGFVHFYAAVPIALLDVVKQAVVSAYPSARLEEVADYNIFSPTGKISGTVGGELSLKEHFAYPISTYQDLKRDSIQALLNALATLEREDGAGIQILMRPADPSWRSEASDVARKKRDGGGGSKKGGEAVLAFGKDLVTALAKPPEGKKDGGNKPELSSLEQATLDSIEEKTRHSGYEVLIRVVASSNINQRAQSILSNIVASFSLFDAPGKNGFKYTPAKSIEDLVSSYILRIFPQNKKSTILNSVELSTLFHFPDQRSIPTSQLERQESKQVDAPRNVPDNGLLLGYNVFRGVKKPIRLSLADRQRHMYVVGQTGTGKSTFLENLAYQDMLNGDGFAFVDPHGDTAERLLSMVPKERVEDVIYFSPADMDYPMGLNLFEYRTPDQKDFLIQEVLNMLYKLYDPQHQGIIGPRYEHLFRNAALTVMADPNGGTFVDIPKLFRDPQFVKQKLQHVTDQNVIDFWQKEMPQSQRSNDFGEIVSWFVSKFGAFLSNDMMRNIIGQTVSAFDLRNIMDNKKILLVNLSKGRTGQLNTQLLGMIFVMKFQAAAMSRADIPEDERKDFCLYVDEFQNFSTDSFATILSEARKYRLNLIVANQFTTQLTEEIRDAVFGNVGTIVSFRVGQDEDAEALARRYRPTFDASDLLRVPNYNTIVRTLIGGVPTQPFSMATLPPMGTPNPKLAAALKQFSAAKYGRPRATVEKEITERLATKAPLPAQQGAFGSAGTFGGAGGAMGSPSAARPSFGAAQAGGGYQPPKPPYSGSFLDEWMNKRQRASISRPAQWANKQPQKPHQAYAANSAPAAQQQSSPTSPMPQQSPPAPQQTASAPHTQSVEPRTVNPDPVDPIKQSPNEGTIYIDRDGTLHN